MKLDDTELDLIRDFLSEHDDEDVTLENYSNWLEVVGESGTDWSYDLFEVYIRAARSND